ncbi:hypothetical protein B0H19DRAFT_683094 [Mycena capillaripes]|nr:hypothetical protein B0H19DRAFT_683094 [Mycena capillaripes]
MISVFSIHPPVSPPVQAQALSEPNVQPHPDILERFWRRVSELTTRYHDKNKKWIDGQEIRKWNMENRTACNKCRSSKKKRQCVIEEDNPSCLACRTIKIGCDKKPRFVFEMTKEEFFPHYDQFLQVFQNKEPGRLRRYNRVKSKPQWRIQSSGNFEDRSESSEMAEEVGRLEAQVQKNAERVSELEELLLDMNERLKAVSIHAPTLHAVVQNLENLIRKNEILADVLTPNKAAIASAVRSIQAVGTIMDKTIADNYY